MRSKVPIALLVAFLIVVAAPAASHAEGVCSLQGVSTAPNLGDHGTSLKFTCNSPIASVKVDTNAFMNGLDWTSANDCHFSDHSFTCTTGPVLQFGGITYTHYRGCDSFDNQLAFQGTVTFTDGTTFGPTRADGPCHGPPRPKSSHIYRGVTPQRYHAYVQVAPGGKRVREIGIGFKCRTGDRRDRTFVADDFATKLGYPPKPAASPAYVFGDTFTIQVPFQGKHPPKPQTFLVHVSGWVASSKRIGLEYRFTRAGCDSGKRRFMLHS